MTALLALLAILVPASVALLGHWYGQQSDKRLAQEREQSARRLAQHEAEERARLRLDAAMRAGSLFGTAGEARPNSAASASGLLALTQLDHADSRCGPTGRPLVRGLALRIGRRPGHHGDRSWFGSVRRGSRCQRGRWVTIGGGRRGARRCGRDDSGRCGRHDRFDGDCSARDQCCAQHTILTQCSTSGC